MDTNTGESPGHQSQSQELGNSSSEEEMGHQTPTGVEQEVYDDDDEGNDTYHNFENTETIKLLISLNKN